MVVVPDVAPGPAPVLLVAAPPARQRRATVALRLVLAAPHLVLALVLVPVVVVLAVAGWAGAVVDGRLPAAVAGRLVGYLRWQTRLLAYLLLLTDLYPPFSAADCAYPVRLTAPVGRLSRPAVIFRLVLALPALVVVTTVTYGTVVVAAA